MITVEIPLWLLLLGLVLVIYFVWQFAGIADKLRKSEKKVSELESKISHSRDGDKCGPTTEYIIVKEPTLLNFGPGYD